MKCEFILDTNWIHKVILQYIYLLNEISWRIWGSSKKVSRHGKQPDGGSLCQDSTGFSEDAKFVNQTTLSYQGHREPLMVLIFSWGIYPPWN